MNMISSPLFDYIPLWLLFIVTLFLFWFFYEVGGWLGKKHLSSQESLPPASFVISSIFALTAFVLALALMMAASRFEEKRKLVIQDANAIETTYLRAEYLPEPFRSAIRKLLRDYVYIRVKGTRVPRVERSLSHLEEKIGQAAVKSENIQEELWKQAVKMTKNGEEPVMVGLFIQSLNRMIDLHSTRTIASLRSRVPAAIWLVLFFLSFLAMVSIGYYLALTKSFSFFLPFIFILTLSSTLILAFALDRCWELTFRIDQQPIINLLNKLESKLR